MTDFEEMEHHLFTVRHGENVRLDRFIGERLGGAHSREFIKELILEGNVTVDGNPARPGRKLRQGQEVEIVIPPPEELECLPENIPLDILFEDEHLLVAVKPRGMLTHPLGRFQSGTFVNALLYHCNDLAQINGTIRPGIVHRLDRVTSGALVVAKSAPVMNALQDMFRHRLIEKRYLALVEGTPLNARGLVDAPIGRHPHERNTFRIDIERGRQSQTTYTRMKSYGRFTLVELYLHTGRTHQIRVHMRFIGHPVVGDTTYGARPEPGLADGIALHAWTLGFRHPVTGLDVLCRAPLPPDMVGLIHYERRQG